MSQPPAMVIDASVFLRAVFEDEEGHEQALALLKDHAFGKVILQAPTLLVYEVTNGILMTLQGKRPARGLSPEDAKRILTHLQALRISLEAIAPEELLQVAQAHHCTAYDAAYLALAARSKIPFITGDRRLYNTVRANFRWIEWIGDYGISR